MRKLNAITCALLALMACLSFNSTATLALADNTATPLAVLKSQANFEGFKNQHLGNVDEAWSSFQNTFDGTNVRYDLLNDNDATSTTLKKYQAIIVPLLIDLPAAMASALNDYSKSGGKLIITDSGGSPSQTAQSVMQLAGAAVTGHTSTQAARQLMWKRDPLPLVADFSIGSVCADISPLAGASVIASWQGPDGAVQGPAAVSLNNSMFLGWAPGLQGEITANAQVLSTAMDSLVPGITQTAAVQISYSDFQTTCDELNYLSSRTEEAIDTAKQADLIVPFKTIQANYQSAVDHVKQFQDDYQNRRFYAADAALNSARQEFSLAFAMAMPVRAVESRSVWLDRGTIIATANQKGMAALFDKLKNAGINQVYFETTNAGFALYPTQIGVQNPQTIGWDPLGCAVKEAHLRNIELHAWCWIFAVGNIRHNPIIGKEPDFPGPVLSTHALSWALAGAHGNFLPHSQPEFWIDPANFDGRQYLKDLLSEIVRKYDVDGLQLDYIRYPFNGKGTEMGYDWYGRTRFEKETGLSLDSLNDNARQVWEAWKIQQVNDFVHDVSDSLRAIKPAIRISAAVYALPRRWRLNAIQQEWETWVNNGWVDTLNPMTYAQKAQDLTNMASYVREASGDKAMVFPGLSIRQLDTAGLVEQLDASRAIGTLGTTMFACAQLDDKKLELLRVGPYRKPTVLTPQSDPLRASQLLLDNFVSLVNRYLQEGQKRILSDQSSTNEVVAEIMSLQADMHKLTYKSPPSQLDAIVARVISLHETVKDWLRLEAFAQRGFRAQYIANYLGQVKAIMSYAAQRAHCSTGNVLSSAAAAGLHTNINIQAATIAH
jgi:uncharacterized lipoprotein YddW (UPF0748 family)